MSVPISPSKTIQVLTIKSSTSKVIGKYSYRFLVLGKIFLKLYIKLNNTNIILSILFQESVRKKTNEFSIYFTDNTSNAVSTEKKRKLGNSSSQLVMYYAIVSLVFIAAFLLALYIVLFLYSKC